MGWPSIILYVVIFDREYYELVYYSVVLSPQRAEGTTIKSYRMYVCLSVCVFVPKDLDNR